MVQHLNTSPVYCSGLYNIYSLRASQTHCMHIANQQVWKQVCKEIRNSRSDQRTIIMHLATPNGFILIPVTRKIVITSEIYSIKLLRAVRMEMGKISSSSLCLGNKFSFLTAKKFLRLLSLQISMEASTAAWRNCRPNQFGFPP